MYLIIIYNYPGNPGANLEETLPIITTKTVIYRKIDGSVCGYDQSNP